MSERERDTEKERERERENPTLSIQTHIKRRLIHRPCQGCCKSQRNRKPVRSQTYSRACRRGGALICAERRHQALGDEAGAKPRAERLPAHDGGGGSTATGSNGGLLARRCVITSQRSVHARANQIDRSIESSIQPIRTPRTAGNCLQNSPQTEMKG